jgi:hypothetical protein
MAFREALARGDRSRQEQELFEFFFCGLSAVESACYACYFVGRGVDESSFALPPRKVTTQETVHAYASRFKEEPLSRALAALLEDALYVEWRNVRNALAHRCHPGRDVSISAGIGAPAPPPSPDVWHLADLPITPGLTLDRFLWLTETLARLASTLADFAETHVRA